MTTQNHFDIIIKYCDLRALALEYLYDPHYPDMPPKFLIYIEPVRNCIKIVGVLIAWHYGDTPQTAVSDFNKSYTLKTIMEITDLSEYTVKKYIRVLNSYGIIHSFTPNNLETRYYLSGVM